MEWCRKDAALAARMQEFLDAHLNFVPLEGKFRALKQLFAACMKFENASHCIRIAPRAIPYRNPQLGVSAEEQGERKGKEKEKDAEEPDAVKIETHVGDASFSSLQGIACLDMEKIRYRLHLRDCIASGSAELRLVPSDWRGRWLSWPTNCFLSFLLKNCWICGTV